VAGGFEQEKLELVVMVMMMMRRRSVKFIGDIIMLGVMYLNRLDLAKENMHMTPKIEVHTQLWIKVEGEKIKRRVHD
jgi:hypothetical protein